MTRQFASNVTTVPDILEGGQIWIDADTWGQIVISRYSQTKRLYDICGDIILPLDKIAYLGY